MIPAFLPYGIAIAAIISLTADCVTTARAMSMGAREKNPHAARLMEILGIRWGIITVYISYAIAYIALSWLIWLFALWWVQYSIVISVVVMAAGFGTVAFKTYAHSVAAIRNHYLAKAFR